MDTIGDILKKQRLEQKKNLASAAKLLNIKKHYLQMLEANEFEVLNRDTYLIGCLRNYAEWLGLDSEVLVKRLKDELNLPHYTHQQLSSVKAISVTSSKNFASPSLWSVVLSIALAFIIWSLISSYYSVKNASTHVVASIEEEVLEASEEEVAVKEYVLVAMEKVALEILDETYQQQKVHELNAGDAVFFKYEVPKAAFIATTNPDAIEVFFNNDTSDYIGNLKDAEFYFEVKKTY